VAAAGAECAGGSVAGEAPGAMALLDAEARTGCEVEAPGP
jgi:hypothetical protein